MGGEGAWNWTRGAYQEGWLIEQEGWQGVEVGLWDDYIRINCSMRWP